MALTKPHLSTAAAAAASRRAARQPAAKPRATGDDAPSRPAPRGPVQRPSLPRRRLREETRAQMLERLTNPQISLYEAAVILEVCTATVRHYADSGELPHARTPGGQRRFYLRDVLALLRQRETSRQRSVRRR
jgi:excisionase family DNA binding protein